MHSSAKPLPRRIFKALQDETRLAIYICLTVYKSLTVKELSDLLNKGKTTINHHLRKLDEAGVIVWKIKADDKKKLKTRYYSINESYIQEYLFPSQEAFLEERLTEEEKIKKRDLTYGFMRTEALVTTNLMRWMIQYLEEQEDLSYPEVEPFLKTLNLTEKQMNVYKNKEKDLVETIDSIKSKDPSITHIGTHVLIPIREILEWRKKLRDLGEDYEE
ncbi:MAG: ArsR/SmtB family transcription factor [Candidatus Hodarchaeota archaeon]